MSPIGARVEAFFFGDVAAVRPWLLCRGLLCVLAFDCVIDLVPHGGRYGIGGFNVAHFAVLDAIQPLPTPTMHLALLFATALLALTLAISGPTKLGMATLVALYTYGWASSLLDAYQHHYLLSLLLASAVFFPRHRLRDVLDAEGAHGVKKTSAYGYVSFGVTAAIVYFYTAITKLGADFRSGHALGRLMSPEHIATFTDAIGQPDMPASRALAWLAIGAITTQLVTAVAIIVAITQDRRARGEGLVALLALAPISFHLGTEALSLEIGWFGYYMLFIHVVLFAPARWLVAVARALDAPRGLFAKAMMKNDVPAAAFEGYLFAALSLVVIPVFIGIDLPGAKESAIAAGSVTAIACAVITARGDVARSRRLCVSLLVAAFMLRTAVVHHGLTSPFGGTLIAPSEVRYDYYRFVGGDHRRRGERDEARSAYERARMYAPDDAARERMASRLQNP
jgi:hypothetical protein